MERNAFVVALDKLTVSPRNVRKVGTDDVSDLVASIRAHGLINSVLKVEPTDKEGHFAVIAGGRRLRALKLLAKQKHFSKKYEVLCELAEGDIEGLSLAENFSRQAMHPADQFEAFRELADKGQTVAAISTAFNVTEAFVKQRLKLGRLAPALLEAFREGKIDGDQAKAYTLTDDQERQAAMFAANPRMRAWQIKGDLTEETISDTDKRVMFIGLDTYLAAGGTVTDDLFADTRYLNDSALVEKLFDERIQAIRTELLAEGWSDVILFSGHYEMNEAYPEMAYAAKPALTDEQQAEADRIEERISDLEIILDDEPENEEFRQEFLSLSAKYDQLTAASFSSEDKARAIVGLYFRHDGELAVVRGKQKRGKKPVAGAEGGAAISGSLQQELDAIRTVCLAADIGNNPHVALVMTVHCIAAKLVYAKYFESPVELSVKKTISDRLIANQEIRPLVARNEQYDALVAALPSGHAELWDHLAALSQEQLLRYLAVLTAAMTEVRATSAVRTSYQIEKALDSKAETWLTLSDLQYFDRCRKAHILDIVKEQLGAEKAQAWSLLKKKDLAARATNALDGKWLPPRLSAGAELPEPAFEYSYDDEDEQDFDSDSDGMEQAA